MFCGKCGTKLENQDRFCGFCGAEVESDTDQSSLGEHEGEEVQTRPIIETVISAQETNKSDTVRYDNNQLGNPGLRAFGTISLIAGPIIAIFVWLGEVRRVENHLDFWGVGMFDTTASTVGGVAFENSWPTLLVIVAASTIFGFILLNAGKK